MGQFIMSCIKLHYEYGIHINIFGLYYFEKKKRDCFEYLLSAMQCAWYFPRTSLIHLSQVSSYPLSRIQRKNGSSEELTWFKLTHPVSDTCKSLYSRLTLGSSHSVMFTFWPSKYKTTIILLHGFYFFFFKDS